MIGHTFSMDKLVIGGSLESLLYSYITETPIVIDQPRRPSEISEVHPTLNFCFLGYRPEEKIFSLQLWDRLSFLLSLSGLLLFPNSIENIRGEVGKLYVSTYNLGKFEVTFNKLKKFDSQLTNFAWMHDWFAVRSGGKHDIDKLEDEEYLANKLVFYPSKRIGVRGARDVVSITYLKIDKIYDIEYSEAYVSLKTRMMMKQAGIRGTSKGYDRYRKRKFDPIKIEHLHRDITEQIVPNMTLGQILDLPRNTKGKLWKMTASLFRRQFPFI